jgi:hypothetical protein
MKKLFILATFTMFSFNVHALMGKPISSSLTEQVCHISVDNNICTAVRISDDYVLTAQHCVRDTKTLKLRPSLSVRCDRSGVKVLKVIESVGYAYAKEPRPIHMDFALIQIQPPKKANSIKYQAKLLKNLAEYKSIFLDSAEEISDEVKYNKFAENTSCEMHGYGLSSDNEKQIKEDQEQEVLKTIAITSRVAYKNASYFMKVGTLADDLAMINSPVLPTKDRKEKWVHSYARVGDSGGPLFCKSKSGEWILAGITSVMTSYWCPDSEQRDGKSPEVLIAEGWKPKSCKFGTGWGLPTVEAIEKVLGVRLEN